MDIQAAVLERPDGTLSNYKISIETLSLEGPRDDEVLVRVTSCGVCGTDRGCIHGIEPYPAPGVLGHEGAGIVEEVGRSITLVRPGDRVIMGFPYCGVCRNCRGGQPRYCESLGTLLFSGYRPDSSSPIRRREGDALAGRFFQQSSWATHTVALERQLAKVPDGVDHNLMGPLGCSISTGSGAVLNELKPHPGASIAIFGAGAVGLSAVMAARLTGATTIIAIDKDERRLSLARELGATHTISGDRLAEQVKDATHGSVDYAVESTNGSNLVAEACASLDMLGVCAMVGGAAPTAQVKLTHPDMLQHGKRLIGIMGGGGQTPAFHLALMELQASGRFPLEKLVRRYAFADINAAVADSDSGDVVKPILHMN